MDIFQEQASRTKLGGLRLLSHVVVEKCSSCGNVSGFFVRVRRYWRKECEENYVGCRAPCYDIVTVGSNVVIVDQGCYIVDMSTSLTGSSDMANMGTFRVGLPRGFCNPRGGSFCGSVDSACCDAASACP